MLYNIFMLINKKDIIMYFMKKYMFIYNFCKFLKRLIFFCCIFNELNIGL